MSNPKRELELETAESTATRLTTELSTFASLDEARRAVARIGLACRSWGDEETNVALARDLERLLQSYPACVVREIADPVSGIARRHKFMPVLAEVAEFADRLVDQRRAELRRAQQALTLEEERQQEEIAKPSAEERERGFSRLIALRNQIAANAEQKKLGPAKQPASLLSHEQLEAIERYTDTGRRPSSRCGEKRCRQRRPL
jgi:hypothetical protein